MRDPRFRIVTYAIRADKLGGYLLNLDHVHGGPKAALFLTHRFTPETLESTLIQHASSGEWVGTTRRSFGHLFEIRGGVLTPINRGLDLRAIWAVDDTAPTIARLVTAYPG